VLPSCTRRATLGKFSPKYLEINELRVPKYLLVPFQPSLEHLVRSWAVSAPQLAGRHGGVILRLQRAFAGRPRWYYGTGQGPAKTCRHQGDVTLQRNATFPTSAVEQSSTASWQLILPYCQPALSGTGLLGRWPPVHACVAFSESLDTSLQSKCGSELPTKLWRCKSSSVDLWSSRGS